jgi:hypothetical protein
MASVPRLTSLNCAEICSHAHTPLGRTKNPEGFSAGRGEKIRNSSRASNQYLANKVKARLSREWLPGWFYSALAQKHPSSRFFAPLITQLLFSNSDSRARANLWPQLMWSDLNWVSITLFALPLSGWPGSSVCCKKPAAGKPGGNPTQTLSQSVLCRRENHQTSSREIGKRIGFNWPAATFPTWLLQIDVYLTQINSRMSRSAYRSSTRKHSLATQFDQKTLKLIQKLFLKGKDFAASTCSNIFIKEFPCASSRRFLFVPRRKVRCKVVERDMLFSLAALHHAGKIGCKLSSLP